MNNGNSEPRVSTEYEDQKEEFKEKERTSDLLSLNMERSEVFRFERTWHNASAPPPPQKKKAVSATHLNAPVWSIVIAQVPLENV